MVSKVVAWSTVSNQIVIKVEKGLKRKKLKFPRFRVAAI